MSLQVVCQLTVPTENEVEESAKQRASDRLDGDEYPRSVPSVVEPTDIEMFVDKQSGTNTDRDGYRELMTAIEAGEIDQVVASEVSRISRSVRDFSAAVERIVDENDVGLHILDMRIALDPNDSDPYTRAFLRIDRTTIEIYSSLVEIISFSI